MSVFKRLYCRIFGHKWKTINGSFLYGYLNVRCTRCGKTKKLDYQDLSVHTYSFFSHGKLRELQPGKSYKPDLDGIDSQYDAPAYRPDYNAGAYEYVPVGDD